MVVGGIGLVMNICGVFMFHSHGHSHEHEDKDIEMGAAVPTTLAEVSDVPVSPSDRGMSRDTVVMTTSPRGGRIHAL